jgi:hypothetical protein
MTTALIIDLLKKGLLYDMQISICTPQPGTPFFRDAAAAGCLGTFDWKQYDGGRNVIQSYPDYPAAEIRAVVAHARRAASIHGGGPRFRDCDFTRVPQAVGRAEKILIIASGPKWQTERIVEELPSGSEARTHILVRADAADSFEGFHLHPFGEGPLTLESLPRGTVQRLLAEQFDLAIVQLNHNSGDKSDYANVFRLADMLCKNRIAVDIGGNITRNGEPPAAAQ